MSWFSPNEGFVAAGSGTGGHPSISDDGSGNISIADGIQILLPDGLISLASKSQPTTGFQLDGHVVTVKRATLPMFQIAGGQINALSGAVRVNQQLVLMPSVDQSITAVGDSILANASTVKITADGAYTLTSTPTIAAGTNGQILIIENIGANAVTLQNQTALVGSLLRNASAGAVVLGARDSVTYQYSSDDSSWKQIGNRMAL
jgi:hypothetical protein